MNDLNDLADYLQQQLSYARLANCYVTVIENDKARQIITALEKQIPKPLEESGDIVAMDRYGNTTQEFCCPNCKRKYETPNHKATPFCCWCGQAIKI